MKGVLNKDAANSAALPGEWGKPVDRDTIGGYGLVPHKPGEPNTPNTPNTPNEPQKPEKPSNKLPQTGNVNAATGLGLVSLLMMFGLAGMNKRRY